MPIRDRDLRQQICEIGALLYQKNLIAAGEGNISCRLSNDQFLITPAGVCKGDLDPERLVVLSAKGQSRDSGLKPSSEYRLHLAGYQARPDFMAAVHAHPPYVTSFALAGIPLTGGGLPEFELTFGDIPLTPYAKPGTAALANSILPVVNDHHTLLLERHGIIAFGENLREAYYRVEAAEQCARIIWRAKLLRVAESLRAERSTERESPSSSKRRKSGSEA